MFRACVRGAWWKVANHAKWGIPADVPSALIVRLFSLMGHASAQNHGFIPYNIALQQPSPIQSPALFDPNSSAQRIVKFVIMESAPDAGKDFISDNRRINVWSAILGARTVVMESLVSSISRAGQLPWVKLCIVRFFIVLIAHKRLNNVKDANRTTFFLMASDVKLTHHILMLMKIWETFPSSKGNMGKHMHLSRRKRKGNKYIIGTMKK
jgi:hypothetical protein